MYEQNDYARSVFDEINHQISTLALKRYLARHGWKLCFYGGRSPFFSQSSQKQSNPTGDEIIRVAKMEEYAYSVSSFTYRSNANRCVFINMAHNPSNAKIIRLLLHEIGHIVNEHEAIDCILGKGNYYFEKEANSFMRYMMQLQRPHSLTDLIAFHKTKFLFIGALVISFFFYSGFQFLQRSDSAIVSISDIFTFGCDFGTNQTSETQNSNAMNAAPAAQSSASANTTSPSPAPIVTSIQLDDSTMVYIAKTGRVYHLFADCSYIKGHDGVTELPYAYINNKPLCSACQRKFLAQTTP